MLIFLESPFIQMYIFFATNIGGKIFKMVTFLFWLGTQFFPLLILQFCDHEVQFILLLHTNTYMYACMHACMHILVHSYPLGALPSCMDIKSSHDMSPLSFLLAHHFFHHFHLHALHCHFPLCCSLLDFRLYWCPLHFFPSAYGKAVFGG